MERDATPEPPNRSGDEAANNPASDRSAGDPTRLVGEWWCPVCGAAAHHYAYSGRPRIYCSNACRQKAYRWRRQRPYDRTTAFHRGHGWRHSHAMRRAGDLTSGRCDRRGREVTLCGAFASPAGKRFITPYRRSTGRFRHHWFVTGSLWSCEICEALSAPGSPTAPTEPPWWPRFAEGTEPPDPKPPWPRPEWHVEPSCGRLSQPPGG